MSSVSSGSGQDFDLNIAPVIDCFTVLITYLLVSASFLSFSILDIGVAASGVAAPAAEPTVPPVAISAELTTLRSITVKLTGGPKNIDQSYTVPTARDGDWDLGELDARIREIQGRFPDVKEISVSSENTVRYKEIVKVIEALKKDVPKVFLAGT